MVAPGCDRSGIREGLLDHKGAALVGPEFASTVKEMNGSQDEISWLEASRLNFLPVCSGHPLLVTPSIVHGLQSMLINQV